MRSPPRKPTASGSSKSSFHFKTPDGAGTSPAPPFSFPTPQQKAGIPGEAKEDILSVPAGGSSHYGARGRSLWRKAPSPLDPHPKHGGRHLTPSRRYDSRPSWAANRAISSKAPRFIRPRRRFGAFPFGNPSQGKTGEQQWKEKQRTSYLQHLCAKDFLVRGRTDLRFEYSAAGRGVSSLVGSAWRPTSVLGELTDKAVNSSLIFFLFHRARRVFFLMSQKENGGCIPTIKPCILVPQSGTMLHPLRRFAAPLVGAKKK